MKEFIPSVDKFLKEKQIQKKSVLLVDNAPSHITEDLQDGEIKVLILSMLAHGPGCFRCAKEKVSTSASFIPD